MSDDLRSIDISSGVSEQGEPFLTVAATTTRGGIILGQLSPSEVRQMALAWMESAEAAEQDAAVLRTIQKMGLPVELAAAVVVELRNGRA